MTEWLEDDLDLLGLLSDNTLELTDSSCSTSPMSSPTKLQRRRPIPRKVNVSRERQKQELAFLRKKASVLETQLDHLRLRRDTQLRAHFRDPQCTQFATAAPVWEKLTIRQFEARKRSEMQNDKLKRMITTQQRIAEDLMRAIRVMEQRTRHATPFGSTPLSVDVDIPLWETDQLSQLESLCSRWTSEIARCVNWNSLEFADLHVAEAKDHEAVVEVFHSAVLPFSVTRVEEALWSLHHQGWGDSNEDQSFVQEAEVTDNHIVGSFTKLMTLGNCQGTVKGRSVTKRIHPTTTQTGFVTQCQSESYGFRAHVDGVTTVEESWVRLVDAKEVGHRELTGTLTVVQRVHRERIQNKTDNGEASCSSMESVASIVLDRIRTELILIQHAVEAFLVCARERVKVENHESC